MPTPRPEPDRVEPLFSPAATTVFRTALVGLAAAVLGGAGLALGFVQTPYWNRLGFAPDQPVLFSHRHHAGELHLDCRYCHATVERSAFAGMPTTQTCLTCHSQLFTRTPMLEPVIRSAEERRPLRWSRVTRLPDFVYFDHSIHLAKSIGCIACHGPVGDLALMAKQTTLTMRFCLDCHRDPVPRMVPAEALFLATRPLRAAPPVSTAPALSHPPVELAHLTNCSTCHR